ncbi:hypothetical protein BDP81DRAFT_205181 [Colletotrichum phormii]|uniref:Uncharacterized protein n=1 Tax=Colletotrichum phormii TaxID=359342 RepID=A0AAI9ZXA8_9PEZI|nr:uncharacterized protein BDP81DRAFT_205181 [Colletotrichum phormii]KAK1638282.1 hypothetical protein BDP81DRAFT_205181 [Colletotrichum phormii]
MDTCPGAGSVCPVPSCPPTRSSLPHLNSSFAHCSTLPLNLPQRYSLPPLSNAPKTSPNPLHFKSLLSVSGLAA